MTARNRPRSLGVRSMVGRRWWWILASARRAGLLGVLASSGCSAAKQPEGPVPGPTPASAPKADVEPGAQCPQGPIARQVAPDVEPRHRLVETWVDKLPAGMGDVALLDPKALPALNAQFALTPGAFRDPMSDAIADPEHVASEIAERMTWMRAQVEDGTYKETEVGAMAAANVVVEGAVPVDELRLAVAESQLWCAPLTSGLFKTPIDPAFDRNRCASLHPGELVRVLRRFGHEGGEAEWLYADSGHTTGWLHAPALTPVLEREHLAPLWDGPRLVSTRDAAVTLSGHPIRLGTQVPLRGTDSDGYDVLVPTPQGPTPDRVFRSEPVVADKAVLTRRALWTMALAELESPYGWGGTQGARDCSRFLRDMMVTFGVQLGRHSGVQAKLGTARVDVGGLSDDAKRQAIAAAAKRGVVFLYMRGHIMLYLGRDQGHDYAVSALAEWLEPCKGGEDTVYRLDRVAVSTLELGRDTERTAYIERISTLVVFGVDAPEPTAG